MSILIFFTYYIHIFPKTNSLFWHFCCSYTWRPSSSGLDLQQPNPFIVSVNKSRLNYSSRYTWHSTLWFGELYRFYSVRKSDGYFWTWCVSAYCSLRLCELLQCHLWQTRECQLDVLLSLWLTPSFLQWAPEGITYHDCMQNTTMRLSQL